MAAWKSLGMSRIAERDMGVDWSPLLRSKKRFVANISCYRCLRRMAALCRRRNCLNRKAESENLVKFLYFATLAALSVAGSVLLQAQTSSSTVGALPPSISEITAAAHRVAVQPVTPLTLNMYTMRTVSREAAATLAVPTRAMPLRPLGRTKPASQSNVPAALPLASTLDKSSSTSKGFNGMANSPTICPYFGGCQPPDMALAASPKYVLQGVNTSFALYSTSGKLLAGPVDAQNFFGVPDPAPFGCDPAGPFLSDPRAFYDPNTGRFWVAILQLEDSPPSPCTATFSRPTGLPTSTP